MTTILIFFFQAFSNQAVAAQTRGRIHNVYGELTQPFEVYGKLTQPFIVIGELTQPFVLEGEL